MWHNLPWTINATRWIKANLPREGKRRGINISSVFAATTSS
jgi:hypothetical protein